MPTNKPTHHTIGVAMGAKGVVRGVSRQHTIGLRCAATVLYIVYGPNTLHESIAFAQWQVWADLANSSNAAARVATSVLCRLVGERSMVLGCTLAVVYIV